ncbi:MAG: GIY-YIG nuclease family protein [Candidatus Peribacteraceae bacterium]|nr:GIY-YIG nuclease family protein [Candidatus Peribacteraceae bacterium]
MSYHVYIIELDNGSYYVGHTNNIGRRMKEHKLGLACSHTKKFKIKQLRWHEKLSTRNLAAKREKEIKGWRREKKEHLWRGSSLS